jgi:cytochrome d ubiquinol oxidase subunit II
MLYVVIAFLWMSVLLYLLLGGADFGAGIIELFTSKRNERLTRRTMYKAIGPIWEANHMWLIIAIVILFVGFPVIYTTMSVYLHIPLVVMLLGIIARGTAFTFRHYDAVVDDMQTLYNRIFTLSSFITPLFLGIIAGSTVAGKIDTRAQNFADAYLYSWLNFFSLSVGLFTVTICGFLAAIYLIGETDKEPFKRHFIKKAFHMSFAALAAGMLVFFAARIENIPLAQWIFGNAVGLMSIIAAALSLAVLWYLLTKEKTRFVRILAGFQVTLILVAITYEHYPNIVSLADGTYLSLIDHSGHERTIMTLGWALIIGSVFILPALFYLIYSFQKKEFKEKETTRILP